MATNSSHTPTLDTQQEIRRLNDRIRVLNGTIDNWQTENAGKVKIIAALQSQNAELVKALERAEEEITADKGGRVWTCLQVIRAALSSPSSTGEAK